MLATISTDRIIEKIREQGEKIPEPLMDELITTFEETADEEVETFVDFVETVAAERTLKAYSDTIVPLNRLLKILGGYEND